MNEVSIDMWGDYVLWTKDVQEDAWCFTSLDTCVGVRVLRNLEIYGIYKIFEVSEEISQIKCFYIGYVFSFSLYGKISFWNDRITKVTQITRKHNQRS